MAAKGYTTEQKLEDYTLQDIDASFSTRISEWIEAVERYIDSYTGRNFKADAEASARLYDGDDTNELLIDDAVAVTKVEVGGDGYGSSFSEVSASGADRYFLDPANAAVDGLPFRKVTLNARCFPEGWQNNRITAKWGYSAAVPADIAFAATVLVGGIINSHRGGGDKVTMEKIGNYSVQFDTNDSDAMTDFKRTMEILDSYRKLRI